MMYCSLQGINLNINVYRFCQQIFSSLAIILRGLYVSGTHKKILLFWANQILVLRVFYIMFTISKFIQNNNVSLFHKYMYNTCAYCVVSWVPVCLHVHIVHQLQRQQSSSLSFLEAISGVYSLQVFICGPKFL